MFRHLSAVIAGLVIGMIANMAIIMLNLVIYPMPEGLSMDDQEAFSAWVSTLPETSFLLPMVAHMAQAFFGGWVAARLGSSHPMALAMIVGVLSLVGGIINALSLAIPTWMWIEMPFYLVLAWVAGTIELKRRAASQI
jgi:hypothetical protein